MPLAKYRIHQIQLLRPSHPAPVFWSLARSPEPSAQSLDFGLSARGFNQRPAFLGIPGVFKLGMQLVEHDSLVCSAESGGERESMELFNVVGNPILCQEIN